MVIELAIEELVLITGGYIVTCNPDALSADPRWFPIDPLPPIFPPNRWPMTQPACG
jgi:hypothetical protein